MIKAIVASQDEFDGLQNGPGYHPTFDEGDEAIVAGVSLILVGGVWVNKAEYDKRMAEEAEAKAKAKAEAEAKA